MLGLGIGYFEAAGQCSSEVAHWLLVPQDHDSIPGGGEILSFFVCELSSHDCCSPFNKNMIMQSD